MSPLIRLREWYLRTFKRYYVVVYEDNVHAQVLWGAQAFGGCPLTGVFDDYDKALEFYWHCLGDGKRPYPPGGIEVLRHDHQLVQDSCLIR